MSAIKVDTYVHKSGTRVDIYYDKKQKRHWAKVGTTVFDEESFADVHRQVVEEVKRRAEDLKWFPVIEVHLEEPSGTGEGLSISFERKFVAKCVDGVFVESSWTHRHDAWTTFEGDQIPDDVKLRKSSTMVWYTPKTMDLTALPFSYQPHDEGSKICFLPYSEKTYAALADIQERVRLLRGALMHLISSPEGQAKLVAGSVTLPAPERDRSDDSNKSKKRGRS